MDEALLMYHHISVLVMNNDDRVDPEWDETVASLALVVLVEKAQGRAVEDYNRKQAK